jgi:hypothetical protein
MTFTPSLRALDPISKNGIPLYRAALLIDPASFGRYVRLVDHLRMIRLSAVVDSLLVEEWELLNRELRSLWAEGFGAEHAVDRLKANDWCASGILLRSTEYQLIPSAAWLSIGRPFGLEGWTDGRLCLGGIIYNDIRVRPRGWVPAATASIAFGDEYYRVPQLLHAMRQQDQSAVERLTAILSRDLLRMVAGGAYECDALDVSSGIRRRITVFDLARQPRRITVSTVELADGTLFEDVVVRFPDPLWRAPPDRPSDAAAPPNPAMMPLPGSDIASVTPRRDGRKGRKKSKYKYEWVLIEIIRRIRNGTLESRSDVTIAQAKGWYRAAGAVEFEKKLKIAKARKESDLKRSLLKSEIAALEAELRSSDRSDEEPANSSMGDVLAVIFAPPEISIKSGDFRDGREEYQSLTGTDLWSFWSEVLRREFANETVAGNPNDDQITEMRDWCVVHIGRKPTSALIAAHLMDIGPLG